MNMDLGRLLIAIGLMFYGIYAVSLALAMSGAPGGTLILAAFILQAGLAIAAAAATWRNLSWAPVAVVLLGAVIAANWLYQGFVLGIVAYLYALLVAVVALAICLAIAAYLTGRWQVFVRRNHAART